MCHCAGYLLLETYRGKKPPGELLIFFLIFLSFFTLLIKRTSTSEGFLCRFGGRSADPTALSSSLGARGALLGFVGAVPGGWLYLCHLLLPRIRAWFVPRAEPSSYFCRVILAWLIFGRAPSSLCSHVVLPNHHKAHCPCLAQHRGSSQAATAARGALS